MILDHNRMLVDAEFQREDGTWRKVRLWVDTGNPDLFMSDPLARDLGKNLPASRSNAEIHTPGRRPYRRDAPGLSRREVEGDGRASVAVFHHAQ